MPTVAVHKRKYPGRPLLSGELAVLGKDSFGTWLYRARDSRLNRVGVQLMPPGQWWVAWWWIGWRTEPQRRWIAVDICTPPVLGNDGWTYDDLEIDLVSTAAQPVLVLDEDEFDDVRRRVPYPPDIAEAAMRSRDIVRRMFEEQSEPFGSVGWGHLEDAMSRAPDTFTS